MVTLTEHGPSKPQSSPADAEEVTADCQRESHPSPAVAPQSPIRTRTSIQVQWTESCGARSALCRLESVCRVLRWILRFAWPPSSRRHRRARCTRSNSRTKIFFGFLIITKRGHFLIITKRGQTRKKKLNLVGNLNKNVANVPKFFTELPFLLSQSLVSKD